MSTEKRDVPSVVLNVLCPVREKMARVNFDLNIFREKEILTGCTHLDKGETCGQVCALTPEAQELFAQVISIEKVKHAQDLRDVGDVIA